MDKRKPAAVLIAAILAAGMFLSGCSREPQSVSYPVIGTWTGRSSYGVLALIALFLVGLIVMIAGKNAFESLDNSENP